MSYIHSSPWQDAANFGGAIGDRLSEALINLPLKKQQFAMQMLQAAQAQKQQGFENQLATQRVQGEQGHYDAEAAHYKAQDEGSHGRLELKKEEDFKKGLGDIVTGYRKDTAEQDKTALGNRALDIKESEAHHQQVGQYLNTLAKTNTELAGLMVKATHGLPFEPDEQAKFDGYVKQASNAMQQMQQPTAPGIGSAAATKASSNIRTFEPKTGQLTPIQ